MFFNTKIKLADGLYTVNSWGTPLYLATFAVTIWCFGAARGGLCNSRCDAKAKIVNKDTRPDSKFTVLALAPCLPLQNAILASSLELQSPPLAAPRN